MSRKQFVGVRGPGQATLLQRRHQTVGYLHQVAARDTQHRCGDQEAVATDLFHHLTHALRHLVGRADQFDRGDETAATRNHELTQRFATAPLLELVQGTGFAIRDELFRQRFVEVELGEIDFGDGGDRG